MPYTTVNFSDVEDFSALPEGEYGVEIDKVEVRRNKADDGDYLNWELVILDGDYENRRLWMITSLKPNALFRLKQVLEELDVLEGDELELEYDDDQDVTSSSGPRLLYPDLEGLEATVRVKNEMYDGKERNRVDDLFTGTPSKSKSKSKKRTTTKRSTRRDDYDEDSQYDVDDEEDLEEEEVEDRPRSRRVRSASSNSRSDSAPRSRRNNSGRRRLR